MKKLLIIMTLFMSSFFLFSLEDVKAYTFTKEVDFSLIEDVLSLKDQLDTYIETNTTYSDYYFITYENSILHYYFLLSDGSIDSFTTKVSSTFFRVYPNQSLKGGSNLSYIDASSSYSSINFNMYHSNESLKTDIIIYSNFDIKSTISNNSIIYTFQDFSYTDNIVSGNKIMTLYDIYLEYQNYIGNKEEIHQEELSKVESFYSIVIEKLGYLGETLVSNYIYLSIIVIFILIFVFKLIFRRLL